jgi:hypothetical protein
MTKRFIHSEIGSELKQPEGLYVKRMKKKKRGEREKQECLLSFGEEASYKNVAETFLASFLCWRVF